MMCYYLNVQFQGQRDKLSFQTVGLKHLPSHYVCIGFVNIYASSMSEFMAWLLHSTLKLKYLPFLHITYNWVDKNQSHAILCRLQISDDVTKDVKVFICSTRKSSKLTPMYTGHSLCYSFIYRNSDFWKRLFSHQVTKELIRRTSVQSQKNSLDVPLFSHKRTH